MDYNPVFKKTVLGKPCINLWGRYGSQQTVGSPWETSELLSTYSCLLSGGCSVKNMLYNQSVGYSCLHQPAMMKS